MDVGQNHVDSAQPPVPPERYAFGMSCDPREQAVVLYGRLDLYDAVVLADTWILATARRLAAQDFTDNARNWSALRDVGAGVE